MSIAPAYLRRLVILPENSSDQAASKKKEGERTRKEKIYQYDRDISRRSVSHPDVIHDKIVNGTRSAFIQVQRQAVTSSMDERLQTQREDSGQMYRNLLSFALFGSSFDSIVNQPILSLHQPKKAAVRSQLNTNDLKNCVPVVAKVVRAIPNKPFKILDAPQMSDDFYIQPLSWSSTNRVAVILSGSIYTYNATTQAVATLFQEADDAKKPLSLAWGCNGTKLAVSTQAGAVSLRDGKTGQEISLWESAFETRAYFQKVTALEALGSNNFLVGGSTGGMGALDFRKPAPLVSFVTVAPSHVCRMAPSANAMTIATGDNNCKLSLWDIRHLVDLAPQQVFTEATAAIKAITWAPWNSSHLYAGGGTADRHVRLYDVNTGTLLDSVNTGAQVSTIHASEYYKELVSTHGVPDNKIVVWKNLKKTKQDNARMWPYAVLKEHTRRVLFSAMSPDETTLLTGSPDETLRFWKIFEHEKKKEKQPFEDRMVIR